MFEDLQINIYQPNPLLRTDKDPQLGLYGAFGYDLTFQLEMMELKHDREDQRELVLYLPDHIWVHDVQVGEAWEIQYDFVSTSQESTRGIERKGEKIVFQTRDTLPEGRVERDHAEGEFAGAVREAKKLFKDGRLFETVLSQTFARPCQSVPSELYMRLRKRNPAPYMFIINLGGGMYHCFPCINVACFNFFLFILFFTSRLPFYTLTYLPPL